MCLAPSSPSLVLFFYYRSSFGHLSLYNINPESPCGELEFSFVVTLYRQCLQRPPGGRDRVQKMICFGGRVRIVITFCQGCRSVLNPGLGVQEGIWGRSLGMQGSSPFPASPPSGCYSLTCVSLEKCSTWASCPQLPAQAASCLTSQWVLWPHLCIIGEMFYLHLLPLALCPSCFPCTTIPPTITGVRLMCPNPLCTGFLKSPQWLIIIYSFSDVQCQDADPC